MAMALSRGGRRWGSVGAPLGASLWQRAPAVAWRATAETGTLLVKKRLLWALARPYGRCVTSNARARDEALAVSR